MIKLEDGELLNLLPVSMAKDIETQCISYALKRQVQNVIYFSGQTRTVAMIDLLPEHVLDALAVEMRTMYYSQDMPLEQKREIIKSTMKWYSKAGTPSAVEELIQVVFGEGKVTEWFDYREGPYTPGTFDIETSAQLTFDMIARFNEIIKKVKNTRSHLRRIWVMRESEQQVYVGSIQAMTPHWIIEDEGLHYVRQAFYTACIMQPIATISIDGRR